MGASDIKARTSLWPISLAYSLAARSREEELARNFICFGNCGLRCCDLRRNLSPQNSDAGSADTRGYGRVVICVNLCDEARKKHIILDSSAA
jgi:ferrous iron transport protein B